VAGRRSWGAVRKLPSGRWQASFRDPDQRKLVPAPQTFSSKTAADRWLAKKRSDLDRGDATDEAAANKPLSSWWPAYWETVEGTKRTRTRANYVASWRLRVEPHFGNTPVRRIKPGEIDKWINALTAGGTSPAKARESYGILKRVLDLAVRDRAIMANPCAQRSKALPRMPHKDRPVLSPREVEKLAAAMRYDADRVLVRLLAYGGLRIGEAFALRWRDIDFDRKMLTVRESVESSNGRIEAGPTKTHETRTTLCPMRL
jgi:integrase